MIVYCVLVLIMGNSMIQIFPDQFRVYNFGLSLNKQSFHRSTKVIEHQS